jgi:hypothetical protein
MNVRGVIVFMDVMIHDECHVVNGGQMDNDGPA